MTIGELVHYVGISKPEKMYEAFRTEFIVNLDGETNPDLEYKQFRHILDEMHNFDYDTKPFYEVVTEPLGYMGNRFRNTIDKWVREKCCFQSEQYEIDKIYEGTIIDNFPISIYVFITLKQIIYTDDPEALLFVKTNNKYSVLAQERKHPELPTFPENYYTYMKEGTPEFDDKYKVIRRLDNYI